MRRRAGEGLDAAISEVAHARVDISLTERPDEQMDAGRLP